MKKIVGLLSIFVFTFLLAGCSDERKKEDLGIHASFETISKEFCKSHTEGLTYEEYTNLYPEEFKTIMDEQYSKEDYEEDVKEAKMYEECTTKINKEIKETDSDLKLVEEEVNSHYNTKLNFKECTNFDYILKDGYSDDAVVCKLDNNKWYLIMLG